MTDVTPVPKNPILGQTTYDISKDAVTIWLPGVAALYSALAAIWGLPYAIEVVGTIGAFVTFLGIVLKISSNQHQAQANTFDGALIANDPNPNAETFRLEFDRDLFELAGKPEVKLKVVDLLPKDGK